MNTSISKYGFPAFIQLSFNANVCCIVQKLVFACNIQKNLHL